ncbi:hypothetical protein RP20_CCG001850 [Aedes albopictus]|nr:hypothetical protein RP20_CCG001850 [Aedes albopictus]
MKTILFAIVAILVATGDGVLRQIQELKDFQLDEVVPNTFSQRGFNGSWLSDKEFIYRNSNGDYAKYNVESQSETVVLKASSLAKWSGVSITFIRPDVDKALIRYATKKIFRHSTLSKFVVLDIKSGNTYDVGNAEDISVCIVSPNGQSLVYVKDNNVYYL